MKLNSAEMGKGLHAALMEGMSWMLLYNFLMFS